LDGYAGRWWVVHTKSRCEKALAADLNERGTPYFLPLTRARRRYGRRVVVTDLPLFPGYLFLCGEEEDRYAVLVTGRAAAVIRVVDQDRLRVELRHVYRLTASRAAAELYPGLRRGRRCRVARGSLAGLEGVVLWRRGACRICIGVEALGQSAELEIDPSLLEAMD